MTPAGSPGLRRPDWASHSPPGMTATAHCVWCSRASATGPRSVCCMAWLLRAEDDAQDGHVRVLPGVRGSADGCCRNGVAVVGPATWSRLPDAIAVLAVRVAVQDHQVLQGCLIDLVVVLGLDPVGVSLPVLAEQDQRGSVGGLSGEDQVQQDERVRIPAMHQSEQVQPDPQNDDHGLRDNEGPGPEYGGNPVGQDLTLCPLIVAGLVGWVPVPARSHPASAFPASLSAGGAR